MKIKILEDITGSFRILIALYQNDKQRPTNLRNTVEINKDTFYKTLKKLKKLGFIKKIPDELNEKMVWSLTSKSKEIAKYLVEIEKRL